ncbi:hypothetical protein SAMN04488034_101821 [Salinimicrobium catena]|uniref:TonB protein C-terminal n=1 Tax=Salinimicrobium catena TaxID=390640 RepID=A0A1H5JQI4_9FLAO|nr:hypothetical protein [Salinimicrobium catena]SDK89449.1 hypothetical protein SAMN04488140_101807 [Salinimicrobium catena]SEE54799.1 hypothetical protein SAMN04488034_101821 [Salinimicrobium catena]
MKKTLLILFLTALTSCEYFEKQKVSSEEILSEETRELNWQEVDQYPAFEECRELMESDAAKTCFGNKVANYFYARLEAKHPVVTESIDDTLYLYLRISEKGIPAIDSMEVDSLVVAQLPEIKNWLKQSVDSLPKIYPASKRGIPVVTKFKMPIVIQAE